MDVANALSESKIRKTSDREILQHELVRGESSPICRIEEQIPEWVNDEKRPEKWSRRSHSDHSRPATRW